MNKRFFTLLAFTVLALPALAQRPAPGLWEFSMSMKGDAKMDAAMAQMQQQMASMPPEQRKQMEAMLAQRGVAVAPGGPGKGMTAKVCLTAEQINRDEVGQTEGNCKTTSKERSGNTLRFKFECSGPQQAKGEGVYTFVGNKELKGQTQIDSVRNGQPQRIEMTQAGKWLGAECGDIKPRN